MRTVVPMRIVDNARSPGIPGENRWKFSIGSIWLSW